MRTRVILPVSLMFALLFAQQAGFVHVLSHLASAQTVARTLGQPSHAPARDPVPLPEKVPDQVQVCAQCLVITLGDGAVALWSHFSFVEAAALAVALPVQRFNQHAASPFLARAPPALA